MKDLVEFLTVVAVVVFLGSTFLAMFGINLIFRDIRRMRGEINKHGITIGKDK